MSPEQLEDLSKAELVEIVLNLQARVGELEELIKRLTQPPKDASNSSTAPSRTPKPNRQASQPKQKRGPAPSP